MNYSTLIQIIKDQQEVIKTNEAELKRLKKLLKITFPTLEEAQPGDKLEDGCIVIERYPKTIFYNERLLIAAPKETEVECQWTPEFQPVFDKLKEHGLNPSDWFIPSVKQLKLAFKNASYRFPHTYYWSSEEIGPFRAYFVGYLSRVENPSRKTFTFWTRAFRFIELCDNQ
jgi:hypothetical protein